MSAPLPDPVERDGCLALLCALPGMTPTRLRLLLARHDPHAALAVVRGTVADPVFAEHLRSHARGGAAAAPEWIRRWDDFLRRNPLASAIESLTASNVAVIGRGDPRYPACLADDPDAPAVLFCRGNPEVLTARRAAVVGTRSATSGGLRWAADLGRALAEHGVSVVSGLARGIDAAAHRGSLSVNADNGVGPVAVVASGPDVVYPREHAAIWQQVVERGLLVSEHPPGSAPSAHAFPQRNRILAALAEVVVVVESRASGGSLITVRHANERDIGVMAVPGSVASRASEGTNRLIRDGLASVALDATDVLVALGLDSRRADGRRFDPRPVPAADERQLLELIGADAVSIEELVLRTGDDMVDIAVRLGRLERSGWVLRSGAWFVVSRAPDGVTR